MSSPAIKYNLAQVTAINSRKKWNFWEWGRGSGKSTGLGRHIVDLVNALPRAKGVIVGETFQQIITKTLSSTIHGLAIHGLHKDLHYFVGERPPKNWDWPEAYQPPLNYRNCMVFYNGLTIQFVSQDKKAGSGRGTNTDFIIGDEAGLLDKKGLDTDVIANNRGTNPDAFKGHPLWKSVVFASTTPLSSKGQWFVDMEGIAKDDPDYFFMTAPSVVNIANLGTDWFRHMYKTYPTWLTDAELWCKRANKVLNGFYAKLSEIHFYTAYDYNIYTNLDHQKVGCTGDTDLDRDEAIHAGMDFGARINCIVACQEQPGEFRVLKEFHVVSPEILTKPCEYFCDYYEAHNTKEIFFWYDSTGNNQQANSKLTYAEQARDEFRKRGWVVHMMTFGGTNPEHHKKYLLFAKLLDENPDERLPRVRINSSNCPNLKISMENAPSKQRTADLVQKDKSSEKSTTTPARHATDYSDALDTVVFGLYRHHLVTTSTIEAPTMNAA